MKSDKSVKRSESQFLPGVLVGAISIGALAIFIWMNQIQPRHMQAFDYASDLAIAESRKVMACTSAYIDSHDGQIPVGTKTSGEGASLVVIGFDAPSSITETK